MAQWYHSDCQREQQRLVCTNVDYINNQGTDLINEIIWLRFEQRKDLATLMYICVHRLAHVRLCNEIEWVCDRHNINTCNSNSLNVIVPKPKAECFRNSFFIFWS